MRFKEDIVSIFNPSHRFPVPLLALERFADLQQALDTESALLTTLTTCCGIQKPDDADLTYFVERLAEITEAKPDTPPPKGPDKKSLGTSYFNALSDLPVDHLLLAAVGYDYAKAEYLYCRADRTVAMAVLDTYVKLQAEHFNYVFECAMYGFGGSYKDDSAPPEGAIDLRNVDDPVAALDALFGKQR